MNILIFRRTCNLTSLAGGQLSQETHLALTYQEKHTCLYNQVVIQIYSSLNLIYMSFYFSLFSI